MPKKAVGDGAGATRHYPPLLSYVLFRKREGRIYIRLTVDEAVELADTLNTITHSIIPNPERWRLIADVTHDLDSKLSTILGRTPDERPA